MSAKRIVKPALKGAGRRGGQKAGQLDKNRIRRDLPVWGTKKRDPSAEGYKRSVGKDMETNQRECREGLGTAGDR